MAPRRRYWRGYLKLPLVTLWPALAASECERERRGPLYVDLHDLPPALFIAAEADPIIGETVEMATHWSKANRNGHPIVGAARLQPPGNPRCNKDQCVRKAKAAWADGALTRALSNRAGFQQAV